MAKLHRRSNKQIEEQPFRTPEQVANLDSESSASPLINNRPLSPREEVDMGKKKHKLWPPNKYVIISTSIIVIALIAGGFWYFMVHKSVKPIEAPVIHSQPKKSLTVASTLTGLQVNPSVNKLPITAVMIENSIPARPQSGLGEAGVVIEALAEGGISRFVAFFQSQDSTSVGPVRSARPYFIGWAMGFDATYAHVGGSPQGLQDIAQWGIRDMNEFYNGNYYHRISSRQAPHNMYTTLATLYQLEKSKGYTSSTFTSWPRKSTKPLAKPLASTINLDLSSSAYNVSYSYDSATNSYNRSEGGSAQIDAFTNKQISPKVVIAMVVPRSNGQLDSSGAYYSVYQYIGSGNAYIFQNGNVIKGQWSKSSNSSQIKFTNSNGQAIDLEPGQTWITAISSNSAVSYH